eukprot:scaffold1924_cov140-Skeletonema_menzelii.AAC.40
MTTRIMIVILLGHDGCITGNNCGNAQSILLGLVGRSFPLPLTRTCGAADEDLSGSDPGLLHYQLWN